MTSYILKQFKAKILYAFQDYIKLHPSPPPPPPSYKVDLLRDHKQDKSMYQEYHAPKGQHFDK